MGETKFSYKMQVIWAVLLAIESFLIISCNIVTICIFLKRKFTSASKSAYLIVNLTVADVLVGIAAFFNVMELTYSNEFLFVPCHAKQLVNEMSLSFSVFAGFASLLSLALMALERAAATLIPLYFRRISKRKYNYAIVVSWCMSIPLLIIRNVTDCSHMSRKALSAVIVMTSILIIVVSYTAIFIKMKFFHTMQSSLSTRKHARLSKTMMITTLLALATWIPRLIGHLAMATGTSLANVYMGLVLLTYSNSVANLFVYARRMPKFRQEIKNVLQCRCVLVLTNKVNKLPAAKNQGSGPSTRKTNASTRKTTLTNETT